jgi:hypothetical protein
MSELYPPDASLTALGGTSDPEQDVLFIATGEAPYYLSFYKMLHRLLAVSRRAGDLRVYKDGPMTFGVRAGKFCNGGSVCDYAGSTGNALVNNTVNYVYLTPAGALTVNQAGFPAASTAAHLPLATIVTSAGDYAPEAVIDYRGRALYRAVSALTVDDANRLHSLLGLASGASAFACNAASAGGVNSFAANGASATVDAPFATAGGYAAQAGRFGQWAFASHAQVAGANQVSRMTLRAATTGSTPTELTIDGGGAGTMLIPGTSQTCPNRLTLADETTYAFTVTVAARRDTGAQSAMFKRMLIASRTGGAVSLIGAAQTIGVDINPDAWDVAFAADDTNKSLRVLVTGKSATNIHWVADIEAVEAQYND